MAKQPITKLTNLSIEKSETNKANGFFLPQLTNADVAAIPADVLRDGLAYYNTDTDSFVVRINGANSPIDPTGGGDVIGPNGAGDGQVALFDGTSGKLLQAGTLTWGTFVSESNKSANQKDVQALATGELSGLDQIRFNGNASGIGMIFVDTLLGVQFIENGLGGPDYQVCSLFTGGLPSSSTTPSALVELQSTTGALLLSRMNTTQRGALLAPANGMILYNSEKESFEARTGGNWNIVYTSQVSVTTGTGMNSGITPLVLPYGSKVSVEVLDNQTNGFTYCEGSNRIRTFVGGAWGTAYVHAGAASATGLVTTTTFELPRSNGGTEVAGNGVNGFMYYANPINMIRTYVRSNWGTMYVHSGNATGTGLQDVATPFHLPTGTTASVEVAGNQYDGFMYYDITLERIRAYVNGAWSTVNVTVEA